MSKEIHIFDMDDTLLETPDLKDFVSAKDGHVQDEHEFEETTLGHKNHGMFDKIKQQFLLLFSKEIYLKISGDYIVLYDHKDERPVPAHFVAHIEDFIAKVEQENPKKVKDLYGAKRGEIRDMINWFEEKNGMLILKEPRGFYSFDETIGMIKNTPVTDLYDRVQNKMILTGRNISMTDSIEARILNLGMEIPNFGLYCFDPKNYSNIKAFKALVISNSIKEHGWTKVNFYEDKPNWLVFAREYIEENHPEVEFIGHHIDNIKSRKSL